MLDRQAILADVRQRAQSGQAILPGFPDIALRVRKAIDKDLSISDIAKIVQSDIPLTTRLIQISNSPLYRGVVPVDSCEGALSRLGLDVARNLVWSFTLRRIFTEKHAKTRKYLEKLWKHSIKVGAISFILARITPGFDPSRAMLAGLIHDVGILALLTYAESHLEMLTDEQEFAHMCNELRVPLGELLLKQWNFDDEFVQIVKESENWKRNSAQQPDYADVILLSQLHAVLTEPEKDRDKTWPLPSEVPAYRKFHVFDLGPGASVELMAEAQDEIAELQSLLKI
jgi:HD-like signal output (HDOD) protein